MWLRYPVLLEVESYCDLPLQSPSFSLSTFFNAGVQFASMDVPAPTRNPWSYSLRPRVLVSSMISSRSRRRICFAAKAGREWLAHSNEYNVPQQSNHQALCLHARASIGWLLKRIVS